MLLEVREAHTRLLEVQEILNVRRTFGPFLQLAYNIVSFAM